MVLKERVNISFYFFFSPGLMKTASYRDILFIACSSTAMLVQGKIL